MYSYNIAMNANDNVFYDTCRMIESKVQLAEKAKRLIDVDGSMIQIYRTPLGEVKVFNDYEVDAVYVDSDVELPILKNWSNY